MNRIVVEIDVDDELYDATDDTGLTQEGYDELSDALIDWAVLRVRKA